MADLRAARHLDRAFVRLSLTGDDAHQRGFAGAVAPDQPDAAPGRQRSGRTVQYSASAKEHGDSTQVQHGGGPNRQPATLTTPLNRTPAYDQQQAPARSRTGPGQLPSPSNTHTG